MACVCGEERVANSAVGSLGVQGERSPLDPYSSVSVRTLPNATDVDYHGGSVRALPIDHSRYLVRHPGRVFQTADDFTGLLAQRHDPPEAVRIERLRVLP
jgi:hypothetical protein